MSSEEGKNFIERITPSDVVNISFSIFLSSLVYLIHGGVAGFIYGAIVGIFALAFLTLMYSDVRKKEQKGRGNYFFSYINMKIAVMTVVGTIILSKKLLGMIGVIISSFMILGIGVGMAYWFSK